MPATFRSTWHPPLIWEYDDHVRTPSAAQLVLSSRHPRREHTDKARMDELNREAVARWRVRQFDVYPDGRPNKNRTKKRTSCNTQFDEDILNMLVGMGQILDSETDDPRIVGETIYEFMAELARNWKAEH